MKGAVPFLALTIFFHAVLGMKGVETVVSNDAKEHSAAAERFLASQSGSGGRHTDNWAVLVCASRFWFNYRHIANTLSLYRTVKRLGIPDSRIVLMLADDVACNPRNAFPATVFNNADRRIDLYGGLTDAVNDASVEVDYRGYEVTVENFIRLLTGRHEENVPRSKRLLSGDGSNILVFMTGHGGDEFLKFQDAEEITSRDLADAFQQMWEKKRYHELLFIIDTCQANTLYTHFYSPNILAVGSSKKGQNSFSHHASMAIGVAVIDRFTYYILEFMERAVTSMQSKATLSELFSSFSYNELRSDHRLRTDLFRRPVQQTLITDFFGSVQLTELTLSGYPDARHPSSKRSKKPHPTLPAVAFADTAEKEVGSDVDVMAYLYKFRSAVNSLYASVRDMLNVPTHIAEIKADQKNEKTSPLELKFGVVSLSSIVLGAVSLLLLTK